MPIPLPTRPASPEHWGPVDSDAVSRISSHNSAAFRWLFILWLCRFEERSMRKHDWLAIGAVALMALGASTARAADAAEGEKVFKRVCSACHINTADGAKRLGPTLFGVVGRHSGSVEG